MKKTTGYFHLALHLGKLKPNEEVDLALALNYATDPDILNVPISQAVLQGYANTVKADLGVRLTDPHPSLTKVEEKHLDTLTRALYGVASDIERQANIVANGNKTVFENIIRRIGFHPAKPHAKSVRIFDVKVSGKGMVDIKLPTEKNLGKCTYIVEYGLTTAVNVLPATWQKPVPLGNAELSLSGLPSAAVVAVHYAVVVIPSHKKTVTGANTEKTVSNAAALNKMVTVLPVNKKGKVQLVHGTSFYNFSDVFYIVVS